MERKVQEQERPIIRTFEYEHDFDENGLIYFLGTNGFKDTFVNPANNGDVIVKASSIRSNSLAAYNVCDRVATRVISKLRDRQWISIRLNKKVGVGDDTLSWSIIPTHYTLRHYSNYDTECIRNWDFQGSNDGKTWVTLRRHVDDESLKKAGQSHTWRLSHVDQEYSHFRIFMWGPNSNKQGYLAISGFEIYGDAFKLNPKTNYLQTEPGSSELAGLTPLHIVCMKRDLDGLKNLIGGKQFNVNAVKQNVTPLMCATRSGFLEGVKLLIQNDADVNAKHILTEKSCVRLAMERQQTDVLHTLLTEFKSDIDDKTRDDALILAARESHLELATLLVKGKANVHRTDRRQRTPLHWAAKRNSPELATLLLNAGANDSAVDRHGYIPLHYATKDNNGTVEIFLDHDCGLLDVQIEKADMSSLYSMGISKYGQLGLGLIQDEKVSSPLQINAFYGEDVKQVACFTKHTLAVTDSGKVYSWGRGWNGRLGHGDTNGQPRPKSIVFMYPSGRMKLKLGSGDLVADEKFVEVACGFRFSAVLDSGGQVWTFGANDKGQLGTSASFRTIDSGKVTVGVKNPVSIPQTFFADKKVTTIGCGGMHTLATTEDHETYGWGSNLAGQIGNNSLKNAPRPVRIKDLSNVDVVQLCGGYSHSLARTSEGVLYSWGGGYQGMYPACGHGGTENQLIPKIIEGLKHKNVSFVTSGQHHNFAVTDDGELYAWGPNKSGCLGNPAMSVVPARVTSLAKENVVWATAGEDNSACVTKQGDLFTWGSGGPWNAGRVKGADKPKRVEECVGNQMFRAVVCGERITYALTLKQVGKSNMQHLVENGSADQVFLYMKKYNVDISIRGRLLRDALILAAKDNHQDFVSSLLEMKADVNEVDSQGISAVTAAVKNGHRELAKYLSSTSLDLGHSLRIEKSPLMVAAENGRKDITMDYLNKRNSVVYGQNSEWFYIFVGDSLMALDSKRDDAISKQRSDICAGTLNGGDSQLWKFDQNGSSSSCIINKSDGHALDLLDPSDKNMDWRGLTTRPKSDSKSQRWLVEYSFSMRNELTDGYLNGDLIERQAVPIGVFHGKQKQQFYLTSVSCLSGHTVTSNLLLDKKRHQVYCDDCGRNIKHEQEEYLRCVECSFDLCADCVSNRMEHNIALRAASLNGHVDIVELLLKICAKVNSVDEDGHTPLMLASKNGHIDVAALLIEEQADVDIVRKVGGRSYGDTTLLIAAEFGYIGMVKLLMEHHANFRLTTKEGHTALMQACKNSQSDVALLLIRHLQEDAMVNARSSDKTTALHIAAENGLTDICDQLLKSKADPTDRDDNMMSPILVASQFGHLEIVKLLLSSGVSINTDKSGPLGREGTTPLFLACQYGRDDIARHLILNNAKMNIITASEESPLLIAADKAHIEIIEILLSHIGINGNIVGRGNENPLMVAARQGHIAVARRLIQSSCDIHRLDFGSRSALHLAADRGHLGIVSLLMNADKESVSVKQQDNEGRTPLIHAVVSGHEHVVRILASQHSEVIDLADEKGTTPLHHACAIGNPEIVTLLLDAGANASLRNHSSKSTLHFCAEVGSLRVAKLLLEARVNIELKDGLADQTALHICARNGHFDMMAKLLAVGAEITVKDRKLWTPLHHAASNGHMNVVRLLMAPHDVNSKVAVARDASLRIPPHACIFCSIRTEDISVLKEHLNTQWHRDFNEWRAKIQVVNAVFNNSQAPIEAVHVKLEKMAFSPLYAAAESGHVEILEKLIEAEPLGVNAEEENAWGPLHYAAMNGRWNCVKLLVDSNADMNREGKDGSTALICASLNGHSHIAAYLLDKNADVTVTNKSGVTALDAAAVMAQNGDETVVNMLAKRVAFKQALFVEVQDIYEIQELSSGNFGVTYRARMKVRPAGYRVRIGEGKFATLRSHVTVPVVCKVPKFGVSQDEWYELSVLQNVPFHSNLLGLLGMCMSFQVGIKITIAIMVPFKEGGSLKDFLQKTGSMASKLVPLIKFGFDMVSGADHLHKNGYVHNDIAARNFLLTEKDDISPAQQIVLSDFGLSRPMNDEEENDLNIVPWRSSAPETVRSDGKIFNPSTDIWMMGITFWEMLMPTIHPYHWIKTPRDLIKKMREHYGLGLDGAGVAKTDKPLLFFPRSTPKEWKDYIGYCCRWEPEERISCEGLLKKFTTFLMSKPTKFTQEMGSDDDEPIDISGEDGQTYDVYLAYSSDEGDELDEHKHDDQKDTFAEDEYTDYGDPKFDEAEYTTYGNLKNASDAYTTLSESDEEDLGPSKSGNDEKVSADDEKQHVGIVYSSWLKIKEGKGVLARFKDRYFVLRKERTLKYFLKDDVTDETDCEGTIVFTDNTTVSKFAQLRHKFGISINKADADQHTKGDFSDTIQLAAETQQLQSEWLQKLDNLVKKLNDSGDGQTPTDEEFSEEYNPANMEQDFGHEDTYHMINESTELMSLQKEVEKLRRKNEQLLRYEQEVLQLRKENLELKDKIAKIM